MAELKFDEKYYDYLDELREWGAGEYIQKAFELGKDKASNILIDWMKTFPRKDEDNGG